MLKGRRTTPLPIPGPELERMRQTLAPHYGAQVWEHDGTRVLVVRVPEPEPDLVRDIEQSIQVLNPGDVQELTHALLVGTKRVHAVPTQPFVDLMAARVEEDQRLAARWRPSMQPSTHQVTRLPNDPHKIARLVLRLACAKVAELDDAELDRWSRQLVPNLEEAPLKGVRCVYLVAAKDDVRLDADLFFQDLKARWQESGLQERLAQELVARQETTRARREQERETLLRDLRGRFPRVAVAPVRRMEALDWEAEESPAPAASRDQAGARAAQETLLDAAAPVSVPSPTGQEGYDGMYAAIDALAARAAATRPATTPPKTPTAAPAAESPAAHAPPPAAPLPSGEADADGPAAVEAPLAAAPAAVAAPSADVERLKAHLEGKGFKVLLNPAVPGHALDLAAERPSGEVQRLVARFVPRLGEPEAQAVLQAARSLPVDLALAVAPEAEAPARRRLIATKARWVAPTDLDQLAL